MEAKRYPRRDTAEEGVRNLVLGGADRGRQILDERFTDLKTRDCQDILIAMTDGLKGMSEALAAVFPATTLQTCIVHLIRHSLAFGNWKERTRLATARRPIHTAPSAEAAGAALDDVERSRWGKKFPTVVAAWRRAWTQVIPFAFRRKSVA